MGFENQPTGQLTLFAVGLVTGLLLRGRPAHGLLAVAAAGLPFAGFVLIQEFC